MREPGLNFNALLLKKGINRIILSNPLGVLCALGG